MIPSSHKVAPSAEQEHRSLREGYLLSSAGISDGRAGFAARLSSAGKTGTLRTVANRGRGCCRWDRLLVDFLPDQRLATSIAGLLDVPKVDSN